MIHWKARRLLAQVLDGTLPAHVEGEVRAHADGCRACSRVLAEFVACEQLLGQLPTRLVPAHAPAGLEDRLLALSRWVVVPEPSWAERLGMSALGAGAAAALLALVLTGQAYAPADHAGPGRPIALASVLPIADVSLIPTGVARWR